MTTKKLGKNYIFNLSYQLLAILLPIITTPYVSRVLGINGIGVFNYTNNVVQAFVLCATLGSSSYAIREIAYIQNDKKQVSKIFYEIIIFRLICVLIVIPIYLLFVLNSKYKFLYSILFMNIISIFFDISWFFQGVEDFKKTVIRNFIVKIIGVILIFLFIHDNTDLWKYVAIISVTTLFGQISMWSYLPKYLVKTKISIKNITKHLWPSFVFFIPQLSSYIYTSLDSVLIGIISTEAQVGYFAQAEKIVKMLLTTITSLGTVMLPHIAFLVKQKKWNDVTEKIYSAIRFTIFLGFPMTIGIASISEIFVPWFFGEGYGGSIILMKILAPLILVIGLASITGRTVLIPLDKQKYYNISIILGSVINLILNLILIPKYYAVGAAIATVVAELIVTSIQLYCIRDIIKIRDILKSVWKYIVAGVFMGISLINIIRVCSNTLEGIVKFCSIGVMVYILVLFILQDTLIITYFRQLKVKLLKLKN